MPGGRVGTLGASYERTRRELESQEERQTRLDRQRQRKTIQHPDNAGYLS